MQRARRWAVCCVLAVALLFCAIPLSAEDGSLTVEHPPHRGLANSSLWITLDSHFPGLAPTWQRRYQELRSIARDTDDVGGNLPALLDELKRKFLEAQQSVVFLLLDLAPSTMNALDNYYLVCRLEEWDWYMADPIHYVSMEEQSLATYAAVLREVGEALERHRTGQSKTDEALREALPELRSMHQLLEARVAYLEGTIALWLQPARAMTKQIHEAVASTRLVQAQLWLNYYTQPQRFTRLGWERRWVDLRAMGEELLRGEILPQPSFMGGVVAVFILGGFALLLQALEQRRDALLANASTMSLWQVLGKTLYVQSKARKCALAVGGVVVTNLFLDALPMVHVHLPFMGVQVCLLLISVAVWAHNAPNDPPLALLMTPVITGYLLLQSGAAPLWVLGGMIVTQVCCAFALAQRRQRSMFAHIWLCLLLLGLLVSILGFSRVVALGLGVALFFRAAFVVLQTLYYAKGLHDHPLRLCFVMPLMVAWLYSLGEVVGLSYAGVDTLWDYMRDKALQLFGIEVYLGEVFLLLALGLGLLIFGRLSQQMLHKAARERKVLDSSAVPVIHAVITSLQWVLFLLFALGLLGVDMRSLAFIGGALTVGIGLGLQNIISNFFSGLVIIFARMVRGGDVIEVGEVHGRVQSVNMRATVVETVEGAVLLIPNVEMLNSRLTNWTRNGRHVREDVRLRLTLPMDVHAAMSLMEEVAASQKDILPDPAPTALLLKSDEGVVDIVLQVWLANVDSKRATLSALQTEIFNALARENFSLASPTLDVVVKQS